MINSVKITNYLGESITMELRFPEKSGFLIMAIEGLGPTKADINTTDMAGIDGSEYNSARANKRNVVFDLRFALKVYTPVGQETLIIDSDIEARRQESYKYFPLKKRIRIEIETDNRTSEVYGYVESNEPNIFSSEEGCSVSIVCPGAYLFDIIPSITAFVSVTPLFEFPFSNESLTLNLIEISELVSLVSRSVIYTGDASVGVIIHIHANGSANDVVITKNLQTLAIDSAKLIELTGSDITAGDDFMISTVKGDKYATLTRGANVYNIINTLGQNPTWFELDKGDNVFSFSADTGIGNLQFEILNEIAYEGI